MRLEFQDPSIHHKDRNFKKVSDLRKKLSKAIIKKKCNIYLFHFPVFKLFINTVNCKVNVRLVIKRYQGKL